MQHTFAAHKNQLLAALLVVVAFFVGLVLPSPFFRHRMGPGGFTGERDNEKIVLKDTAGMVMPDGSVYEGSVNARNNAFHGFGVLTKDNSQYEGNWKKGKLRHGKRTTPQSVYEGRFNDDLDNDGFGIITYNQPYVDGKRRQGMADREITVSYAGNWKKNVKSGLGRAVMADSSMTFGVYDNGVLKPAKGANYRVGDKVYGIDVSHYQGDINWDNLALFCTDSGRVYRFAPRDDNDRRFMQPVLFAYMKATEGATMKDETFDIRMAEADRHGIAKGAYHFLHLLSPVEDQVKNFLEAVKWNPGDMPPALDIEVDKEIKAHGAAKLRDYTFTWLEMVEKEMGVRPVIYTRENIRDNYLAKDPRFDKYKCWIARYHPDGPVKEEWDIWQLTQTGRVNGYKGAIDINLYNGDYAAFREFLDSLTPSEKI